MKNQQMAEIYSQDLTLRSGGRTFCLFIFPVRFLTVALFSHKDS